MRTLPSALLGGFLLGATASHAQVDAVLVDPAIDAPAQAADAATPASGADETAAADIETAIVPVMPPVAAGPAAPALIVDDPVADAGRLAAQFHDALRGGDRGAVLALMAPEVTVFIAGKAAHSRSEYEAAMLDAELDDARTAQRELLRRDVFSADETIWVLAEWRVTRLLAGLEVSFNENETLLLRHPGGNWKIVHRHVSAQPLAL